jgi:hypothetical protein
MLNQKRFAWLVIILSYLSTSSCASMSFVFNFLGGQEEKEKGKSKANSIK